MEKGGTLQMLLVAAIVIVVIILWQRRQATIAANSVQPSGYAGAVGFVNDRVSGALEKVPYVGGYLDSTITKPVSNVLSGDWSATFGSAVTGGLSDLSSKLNPFNW